MAKLETQLDILRISSIDELRNRHYEKFIRLTFRSLLGREADSDGLHAYTTELRKGVAADRVIEPIATSAEARLRWQGAVLQVKNPSAASASFIDSGRLVGGRNLYYFVDHTTKCPTNTGLQRVVRRLGRSLVEAGEKVWFVKWQPELKHLVLVNQQELANLRDWNGP